MTHTMKEYPQLNEKDKLLLALTCLDYSCAQIAIIMNYTNSTTVSSIRQRLAQKMGLSCSLKEYAEQFQAD